MSASGRTTGKTRSRKKSVRKPPPHWRKFLDPGRTRTAAAAGGRRGRGRRRRCLRRRARRTALVAVALRRRGAARRLRGAGRDQCRRAHAGRARPRGRPRRRGTRAGADPAGDQQRARAAHRAQPAQLVGRARRRDPLARAAATARAAPARGLCGLPQFRRDRRQGRPRPRAGACERHGAGFEPRAAAVGQQHGVRPRRVPDQAAGLQLARRARRRRLDTAQGDRSRAEASADQRVGAQRLQRRVRHDRPRGEDAGGTDQQRPAADADRARPTDRACTAGRTPAWPAGSRRRSPRPRPAGRRARRAR